MILTDFSSVMFSTSKASDGGMGFLTTEPKMALANRVTFFRKLGLSLENAIGLRQMHGDSIHVVSKKDRGKGATTLDTALEADALITNEKDIFLLVVAADCNQIALFDPVKQAIGLVHAGRIGLEKEIVIKTIQKMQQTYHTTPKDLIAQFGPSIDPCCYFVDIWEEAEKQLKKSGVLEKNISNPRICTYNIPDYFSHKRATTQKSAVDPRFLAIFGMENV